MGVPLVFALGWALPLFGIPLAVFLVVDALTGGYRRTGRNRAPAAT